MDALQWNGDGDTSADPVTPVKGRRQNPVPAGPRVYNLRTLAAIQNVSTAFLDMVVRQRQQARQWLQQAASVWPGTTARLTLIGP